MKKENNWTDMKEKRICIACGLKGIMKNEQKSLRPKLKNKKVLVCLKCSSEFELKKDKIKQWRIAFW